MDLSEMLALLPDNNTGAIDAADLRAIVTELFTRANSFAQVFSYQWTGAASPAGGRVNMSPVWQVGAATLLINETTDSGITLQFTALDRSAEARIILDGVGGGLLYADVTGPSVDKGSYREVPITVTEVVAPGPIANDKVNVTVITEMP